MFPIKDLAYVRFEVADLAVQANFMSRFGMQITLTDSLLVARGADPGYHYVATATDGESRFAGLGFEASSAEALAEIAAIDGAAVEPITDLPGGGERCRLIDPNGFEIDVISGVESAAIQIDTRNPINMAGELPRKGKRAVIPESELLVKRLGHCVINVIDFRESEAWYKARFKLITSDEIYIGEEDNVLGSFMRVNRGEDYVDHHTLFCVGIGEAGFNHAAFEVTDWDALMIGHDRLKNAGDLHSWGIGKHLLGSQVFDYWKDPHGFTLEHFTDGDVFNEAFGSHKQPIEKVLGLHWGPEGSP